MTIKSLAFLALLAPLMVVGCASETTSDEGASSEGDELSGSGPNAWQHQGQPLGCAQTIGAKVTKTSRRHVYDLAGEAGTKIAMATATSVDIRVANATSPKCCKVSVIRLARS